MANVIRQDVVKIGFDIENNPISKLNKEIENLKKVIAGLSGVDSFEELSDNAKKAEKGMKGVKKSADETNSSLKKVGSTIGKVTLKVAKFAAIGLGTAATGAVAMVKQSVDAYAEYEQLFGGMQTLLGAKGAKNVQEYATLTGKSVDKVQKEYDKLAESEKLVMKNANDAFKTAGMSANEYMNTITSFAASLKSSVGDDAMEAAKLADVAIKDMADNANKMGTPLESISVVYSNLARGMYMTLDNLKLGYAGTKEGALQLVNDAAKIDKSVKSNDISYANLVKAIHAVQVKMDIYGTTSKEAFGTITGSMMAFKSAWGNLMPALIKGGDEFDQCLQNLIDSIIGFQDETGKRKGGIIANLLPATEKALGGLGQLIEGLAPTIEKLLPDLIDKLLPPLVTAAAKLFAGLIKSLPTIISTFAKELPSVFKILGKAISDTFGEQFPVLKKFGNVIKESAGTITKFIPVVLGLVAAFKGFKMFKSISSLFGGKAAGGAEGGESGGGLLGSLTNTFKTLAQTKPTVILKGMANLAIILGGMTILTAAFMAVAPYISKLADAGTIAKMLTAVGALGAVGFALAKMAGIVGVIPITTVLKGLANIALVVAGMSALYLLIGAVSLINFDIGRILKISAIIGVLGTVGATMAVFAGIVGLIPIPVVLAGLANMALVLGGVTALIVAYGALSKIEGFNTFIEEGGKTLAKIFGVIGECAGSIVGGIGKGISNALPAIGKNLGKFGKNIAPLFKSIKGVDLKSVGTFFTSIVGLLSETAGKGIVEGIKKLFGGGEGESPIAKLGTQLTQFGENAEGFFLIASGIDDSAFKKGKQAINTVKSICSIKEFKKGKVKLAELGGQLSSFAVSGKTAFDYFANYPDAGFEKATQIANSVQNLGNLNFNTANIDAFVEALNTAQDKMDKLVKDVGKLPEKMGKNLKASGKSLSDALVSIWKDAVIATTKPVNKLIAGANWILKEFGSTKTVATWTPYAKGTDGHKGGNALVNDGRGAELVQMPNGKTFIPQGKNIFIPNAPKGMKVLPAEQTAQLMGRKSPMHKYAKGTGNIDIWSYMDNASGLIEAVKNQYVSYDGVAGVARDIGKGMVNTISGEMTAWAKKLYDEFGALSLADYIPSKGVEQWRSTVIRALQILGLYSEDNVRRTLYQMQTESGGNPRAINLWDSNAKKGIPSKGLMQVIDPTFKSYAHPSFNKNIYDPLSNILASMRYAVSRYGSLAKAYRGVGYANGGFANTPSIFGEDGLEVAIPLSKDKRKRALNLYKQTGRFLGYTPESTATGYYQETLKTEQNTYAPVFNLTINGAEDTRTIERKVKKWVKESISQTFDSMNRRDPTLQAN